MAFLVNAFSLGRSINNLVTSRHSSILRPCFLQNVRTLSAAAGNNNNYDTPIRLANDYDNNFFSAVAPKKNSIPKPAGYGFFDSSDHVFDQTQEAYDSAVESVDDDVASFRARYQRPVSSRTREEMPLPITYNDDEQVYETNYNWFDDTEPETKNRVPQYKEDEVEGGKIVKSTARIIQSNELQNPIPRSHEVEDIEGGKVVQTSAKILRPTVSASRNEPKVVKSSARIIPIGSDDSPIELPSQQPMAKRLYTPGFMEPDRVKAMTNHSDQVNTERVIPNMGKASLGSSSISYAATLQSQIEHLRAQIYQMNEGKEFNIDSPKQVSRILFGEEGKSTNKDALEALASTGNQMAACIYKYRKVSREYKRELKKMEQMNKGDKKNDYYGNLTRQRSADTGETNLATQTHDNEHSNPRREPLLLIDTSAYIFRSYHAIPPLHHSDGTPTGALHGVCRMLQNLLLTRLLKGDRPRVVLAFDSKGDNFRHKLYAEYKANRGPCPEDLIPQFDLVKEAADAFGIVQVEADGYEADDVIATLAKRAVEEGVDVDILSGDKDLMQLITPM
eukprot:scaffold41942_cov72-Cyclotella_meneghiniana.AAC.9